MGRSAFPWSWAPTRHVDSVQFGVLSPDEVRRMSVAEIKEERLYENGEPKHEGLVDSRLGSNAHFRCTTCHGDDQTCPGHFGHIELAKPMYNVGFVNTTLKILRCVCYYCSKILCNDANVELLLRVKKPVDRLRKALLTCSKGKSVCSEETGCGHEQPKYSREAFRIKALLKESGETGTESKETLDGSKVYAIFKRISDRDCRAMGFSPEFSRPEWFLVSLLPVPPPHVRPSVMRNGSRNEDDLTSKLGDILRNNNLLKTLESTGAVAHVLKEQEALLQYHVVTYMNNEFAGVIPATVKGGGRNIKSIGQRFKGKEGRVRGNLMGKRVDFSARTVITPDPNLKLHEVGVPISIAMNLTYPEIVTPFNREDLTKLVMRGPHSHPGVNYIESEDRVFSLYFQNPADIQLTVGMKVFRHIRDGDYVLFNRQPSLHKMSIMGHRIRVLPYSTFRLNLSVTSPYNADFDGDEMNLHVPQSHLTRAEVQELMLVPHCIVSPQGNKPVMGIVQDTLLGCMLFTQRDTFLERDLTMNLLMHVGDWDGVIPEPAIYKPRPLWTGKQIFSLILPAVNLVRFNITHPDDENTDISPGDTKVYISRGELVCGIVDKRTVGTSANGLIHVTWKQCGAKTTDKMISQIQVLVNHYVLQRGQSIGIGDTIADTATMSNVIRTIQSAKEEVKLLVRKAQEKELVLLPGKGMMESFETEVNKVLNGARDKSGASAQKSLLKSNNIKRMVSAGSKGSFINISQICACVGQQNVEGKRIAYGFNRRTLPHFVLDDLGPESRGFVENSYLRGLTPSEFFFHAMGGREGLIDTAVKTAETGYIQRRLIKAMEDVMVRYDGTVRNSVNHIVEFLYGEDGMDATFLEDQFLRTYKMSDRQLRDEYYLNPMDPGFGRDSKGRPYLDTEITEGVRQDAQIHLELKAEFSQIQSDRETLRHEIVKNGEAKRPLAVNVDRVIWNAKQEHNIRPDSVSDLNPDQILKGVKMLMKRTRVIVLGDEDEEEANATRNDDEGNVEDRKPTLVDPIAREVQENATLLFQIHLRSMLACKKIIKEHRLTKKAFVWVLGEIETRFLSCRVAPGENIGAIAAQSIGEPATQMTLNTFHYAGVSAKNVTLGVPRLKEIINVSKNTKTPSLTVYLKPEFAADKEKAKEIQASLQHTTLRDVTQCTEIYYDPDPSRTVVAEDEEMVSSFFEIEDVPHAASPWLLRIVLDKDMLQDRSISMDQIERIVYQNFGSDVHVIRSQDNDERIVLRLRVTDEAARDKYGENGNGGEMDDDEEEDDEDSDNAFLKRLESELLSEMNLGGISRIRKVFMRQSRTTYVDESVGRFKSREEWVLDTDGVNLIAVMSHEAVDHTRTTSNDIVEIFEALGIEAVREALMNEIRGVISFDGAYVNYRHLAILVDTMTYRGHLMAITRHGINRVDTGPLMKCSFEETTDILLEAAQFGEKDHLRGVSENIMLGQLPPIGTGSFKLLLNEDKLKDAIEPEAAQEQVAVGSPLGVVGGGFESGAWSPGRPMATPGRKRTFDARATPGNAYSPAAWQTPNRMGSTRGASPFNMQFSPTADDAQFSPMPATPGGAGVGGGGYTPLQSPGREYVTPLSPGGAASPYHNQSPAYASSPGYAASPAAGGAGGYGAGANTFAPASPGYRLTSPGPSAYAMAQSPGAQSPGAQYSPTSPGFSPTSPAYTPSGAVAGAAAGGASYSPTSPSYNAPGAASPAAGGYGGGSASLAYSPSSPAAYSHSSPGFAPSSPAGGYAPSTPAYAAQSPGANRYNSYGRGSNHYSPSFANNASPSSPQYSPSSPQYSPR
ncbi:DNA-directed RNA polymerase rpb1 [Chondrus crispus]|uniref:DNA-directed RNA polymerase subunit n=1 Tax=Chondrus crispus TaxID=2769 RepID=R7QLG5_CHOCR|nr:DNA-directed RNA polymerase rpb1 [Chondrus crispus]CDF38608.1 DNA-directed RNA polymerase rpb1 [Chondrus crispus]|eukprot:XP_005718513.1 DNA-directed RNA polymerase rpb1 [Chondrus crispus]